MAGTIAGEKINKPVDPENPTDLEKKHIPVISTSGAVKAGSSIEVNVVMGEIPHPMEEKHYIEWVELYLQGNQVGRAELSPSQEKAETTFKVEIDSSLEGKEAELRAVERCNIHGIWEKYITIKVS